VLDLEHSLFPAIATEIWAAVVGAGSTGIVTLALNYLGNKAGEIVVEATVTPFFDALGARAENIADTGVKLGTVAFTVRGKDPAKVVETIRAIEVMQEVGRSPTSTELGKTT
jgi:hypothetical protein